MIITMENGDKRYATPEEIKLLGNYQALRESHDRLLGACKAVYKDQGGHFYSVVEHAIAKAETPEGKMTDTPAKNTDREIYREKDGDYFSPSIHVTENGGIGINVGGTVIVKSIKQWHEMAAENLQEKS